MTRMSEPVEIRALTPADACLGRSIALLGAAVSGVDRCSDGVAERAAVLAEEIAAIDPDGRAIFVAWRSGQLVGFCRMSRDAENPSDWWLQGLLVHPDHQRRGLATALVTQGMVYAQERGAAAIGSMTQRGNVRSIQFHESLGFEQQGHLTLPDGTEMVRFCLATG